MTTEMIENGSPVVAVPAPAVAEANPLGELSTANNQLAEHLIDLVQNPVLCRKLIGIINSTLASAKPKVLDAEGNPVEEDDDTEIKPGETLINEIKTLMGNRETASRAIVRRALSGM